MWRRLHVNFQEIGGVSNSRSKPERQTPQTAPFPAICFPSVVPYAMGNHHSLQPEKEKEKEKEPPRKERERDHSTDSTPTSKTAVPSGSAGTTPTTGTTRHEKHRSRTITATPLPPTETKVNAEQSHKINNETAMNGDTHARLPLSSHPSAELHSSAEVIEKEKEDKEGVDVTSKEIDIADVTTKENPSETMGKVKGSTVIEPQRPIKQVVEAVKPLDLGKLPPPTVEEIKKQAAETEPTPRFETIKNVGSETSIIDEEELNEADGSPYLS